MRRFLGSKFSFGITLLIFALGLGTNAMMGGGIVLPSHACSVMLPTGTIDIAHGPVLPPDPWTPTNGLLTAHGPVLPPDPWTPTNGLLTAHGPVLPPDPWTPTNG